MRITVDAEQLFYRLLSGALPDVTVQPSVDVDSIDYLPLLVFDLDNGQMVSNGHPSLGWSWDLGLNLYTNDRDAGSDLADRVYGVVHGWDDVKAVVPGVGGVSAVEDDSMFTRTARAAITGDEITQFTGSFSVIIRPAAVAVTVAATVATP